ncbi:MULTISPECIES: fumarate hydratase C-terminal domain-containing protein [Methanobacterium]|uniref:Fumarate hydratase n=1 Tax=Methanobacterium bryantii TaxID=2161 RepID=A0A2A2H0Z5_METBR|nr:MULTISPECIES: fumarate hydratase C-terminal domain-containing protein [Methanobacterium]OEC88650.1 fumarate hydratase [Methanobacterium sp. A39]PAV02953.1 fumarate hydratase [Methanobacterium bryantii]
MTTKIIKTPVTCDVIEDLKVGDRIEIHGKIYTGRDAALPKLIKSIKNGEKLIDIDGSAVMHTAVSDAGISPTTSNKEEIEESIPFLSEAGVKIHIGKGGLSEDTIKALDKWGSIFVVTPPAAALLTSKVVSKQVAAFEEEGMEAIHELVVDGLPGIVAIAHGESIY